MKTLRLNSLKIYNYKKIDILEMDFLPPIMQDDVDILMLGSKNGGGKTSVLECCALLLLAFLHKSEQINNRFDRIRILSDLSGLLVKAGQEKASIRGEFQYGEQKISIGLDIDRKKGLERHPADDKYNEVRKSIIENYNKEGSPLKSESLLNIFAISGEPVIDSPLLFFNSHRKIQESNPDLSVMSGDDVSYEQRREIIVRRSINSVSAFKTEVLRSLIWKAGLFEKTDEGESIKILDKLNFLMKRYCGGEILKLQPSLDNTLDIRVQLVNQNESFSFNGLSSGQKEIIATLFLIWKNTHESPSIVLIDEPELHLNAEWHGDFVRQLYKLVPHNQYILATHSEDMFSSVDKRHRAVLVPD